MKKVLQIVFEKDCIWKRYVYSALRASKSIIWKNQVTLTNVTASISTL